MENDRTHICFYYIKMRNFICNFDFFLVDLNRNYAFRLYSTGCKQKFPFSVKINWKIIEIMELWNFDYNQLYLDRNTCELFLSKSSGKQSKCIFRSKLFRLESIHPKRQTD